jgi:hypothetical protein
MGMFGIKKARTWNLSISGIAPASSGGMDIDKVDGVLQNSNPGV